jgi:hypothetical protein
MQKYTQKPNISIPLGFSIWLKKIYIKCYSEIETSLTFVFKNMKENKCKVYKWNLIHYILPCIELLFKWHITTNNVCTNCQITENYEHFFFECKRLETFWRIIQNLFSKLKLGEHILTLKYLVTGYKIKEEYNDINYLRTIIEYSIYKSYYVSNQRRKICDIINILVREYKFIRFYGRH